MMKFSSKKCLWVRNAWAKSFFSKNCHFLEKKNPGLQCDFHHMSNGNSFYGKELIKTPGKWQGGNDWQSPLPWLPQLAHRATCYPSTPASTPRYTQYTPVHPITPATHQHSVTNNAEVESGKKTETRATDAAMPINGGATRAGTSGDPLITRNPQQLTHLSQQPLQCLLHASVIYRGSFILDDYATARWMHAHRSRIEGFTTH